MSDTKNLTLLGANTTDYSADYNPAILETFDLSQENILAFVE